MTLSKEAIQEISRLTNAPSDHLVYDDNDNMFEVDNSGKVRQIFAEKEGKSRSALRLMNLSSLVDYIKSDLDRSGEPKYLHIASNTNVVLKSVLLEDGDRETLVHAEARIPEFSFERYHDSESFLIALNSRFVNGYDRDKLIAFAGNVKEENARQTSDDGFSQKTVVKRGIASAQEELVPNPVVLAPFRTFQEIEQVPSEFIFRMTDGPKFALFEADGGAWINQTIYMIEEYLANELKDELESGRIVILS